MFYAPQVNLGCCKLTQLQPISSVSVCMYMLLIIVWSHLCSSKVLELFFTSAHSLTFVIFGRWPITVITAYYSLICMQLLEISPAGCGGVSFQLEQLWCNVRQEQLEFRVLEVLWEDSSWFSWLHKGQADGSSVQDLGIIPQLSGTVTSALVLGAACGCQLLLLLFKRN